MDDAAVVCGLERSRQLTGDFKCLSERHWTLCHTVGQRWRFNELEHERVESVHVLNAVGSSNVRVIEGRQHPRLALESGETSAVGGQSPAVES